MPKKKAATARHDTSPTTDTSQRSSSQHDASETPMTDYSDEGEEDEVSEAESFDEYDLDGFTREEVERYNRMASPGSRLKRKASVLEEADADDADNASDLEIIQKPGSVSVTSGDEANSKVTHYIYNHDFYVGKIARTSPFTTSERRGFERDVYDYARCMKLSRRDAGVLLEGARDRCRREWYVGTRDSFQRGSPRFDHCPDVSEWEGEVDDSENTLKRLEEARKSKSLDSEAERDKGREQLNHIEAVKKNSRTAGTEAQKEQRRTSHAEKRRRLQTSHHFPAKEEPEQGFHSPMMHMTAAAEGVSTTNPIPPAAESSPQTHATIRGPSLPPTPTPTPRKKRVRAPAVSPYFPLPSPAKSPSKRNISCIPFPPLSAPNFGLIQERLSHDPFRLLIATIFLNKTRGAVALPVFYHLLHCYPTIAALAAAKHEDIVAILQHLGLQNARARKIVALAQTWLERPPQKGKRYRCLHYPCKGDGKDVAASECLADESEDARVGWEVAHLPGIGAYGFDSWRIFCRDQLRGLQGEEEEGREGEEEWTRVLPLDKELRAYLRWRWLRVGWVWDPLTGERARAGEEVLREAEEGGVMIEGEQGAVVKSETVVQSESVVHSVAP